MYNLAKFKFNKGRLSTFLVWIMLITFLFGCSKNTEIILTTGFYEGELFRIGDISGYSVEALCYLANTKNRYSSVFGEEIWSTSQNGVLLGDSIKDIVLGRLIKIKNMVGLANQYGITLNSTEQEYASNAAKEYYDSLSDVEIAAMGNITREQMTTIYSEYALAEKLYNTVVSGATTEISDDEARTVILKELVFTDINTAEEAKVLLDSGQDFGSVMMSYPNSNEEDLYYRKGELPESLESVAFSLGIGEYSAITGCEGYYYILYCVNTNDTARTEVTKQEILKQRQQELFATVYDEYVAEQEMYLNDELWESIDYNLSMVDGTTDFFDVYEKYFNK